MNVNRVEEALKLILSILLLIFIFKIISERVSYNKVVDEDEKKKEEKEKKKEEKEKKKAEEAAAANFRPEIYAEEGGLCINTACRDDNRQCPDGFHDIGCTGGIPEACSIANVLAGCVEEDIDVLKQVTAEEAAAAANFRPEIYAEEGGLCINTACRDDNRQCPDGFHDIACTWDIPEACKNANVIAGCVEEDIEEAVAYTNEEAMDVLKQATADGLTDEQITQQALNDPQAQAMVNKMFNKLF